MTARSIVICLALLSAINIPLSMYRWIPGDSLSVIFIPLAESVLVLWLITVAAHLAGRKRSVALAVSAAVFAGFAIFSAAEAFFQFIYARSFIPQADIPMVRGGLLLLFGEIGAIADIMTPVVIALTLLTIWGAGLLLGLGASQLLRRYHAAIPPAMVGAALAVPLLLALASPQLLSATVVRSLVNDRGVEFVDVIDTSTDEIAPAQKTDDGTQHIFPGLLDRDIYVFVIEAYGYAAFSREDIFRQLEPDFARFTAVLEQHGYGVKSNYLLSPVAGGFSWLAEATFLTGQWIDSQPRFEQLYDNQVTTLSAMLHAGGYRTFTARPGTVHGSWPEGWELYRFKDSLIAYEGDFDYRGPGFSFVPITDQFAIWKSHQQLQQLRRQDGTERPVLAYYQLVSSHTPFNRIPPYIEDWHQLGDGSIYHQRSDQILTFDNTWGGGSELDEGFVASISYVFTVISEYIDRFVDHERNPIFIVFGDHQPQRPIREQNAHLSVPIHIASRDPQVLELFTRYGYEPGIRGEQQPPHPRMSEFFPMFADIARNHAAGAADVVRNGKPVP